jgi:urease accessory protein
MGYLWAWTENQVASAIKLVPLGQTSGQRILSAAIELIPQWVESGLTLADEDIGALTPGLAIASALHETQYTRLFRS